MPFWKCKEISWSKTIVYSIIVISAMTISLYFAYNITNDLAPAAQIGWILVTGLCGLGVVGLIEAVFGERILLKKSPEIPVIPEKVKG